MKVLVDADACPRTVLQICLRLERKYNIPIWTVASFDHRIELDHPIVVGDGFQETEIKIVNLTESGDVVVTDDLGLAAMALGKGAKCLSPIGKEFHPGKMDFLLQERDLKAKFRRGGGRTKGPRKRTSEDDRRFESSLEKVFCQRKVPAVLFREGREHVIEGCPVHSN